MVPADFAKYGTLTLENIPNYDRNFGQMARLVLSGTTRLGASELWEQLRAEGLFFLMTNRLNQDCLENSFSTIRQKGGFRDSPDTEEFKASVKALMSENVMRPSWLTNCEEDLDEVLLCASSFPSGNLPPDVIDRMKLHSSSGKFSGETESEQVFRRHFVSGAAESRS
ncbi:hypothetical protein HPB47_010894 [Ixodes persulcatus]|uniref:Uncharacterized protein n=1 Tax=Ixodes persulcatus TaxID=34615 RepID=A0AC60NY38_IXOPE|nr:hypothetical protein HPB47_010894 [Ixodes persulcatus]